MKVREVTQAQCTSNFCIEHFCGISYGLTHKWESYSSISETSPVVMEYAKQTETLPRRNQSLSWICSLASWPCSFMLSRHSSMCAALPRPTVNGNKFVQRLSQGIHLSRVFIARAWHESWTAVCLWCLPLSWFKFQPALNFRFFGLKNKVKSTLQIWRRMSNRKVGWAQQHP